jgi:hypothetical protein
LNLNALFQRVLWLAYSLTAHWRVVTRRRGARMIGRRGFHESVPWSTSGKHEWRMNGAFQLRSARLRQSHFQN